MRADGVTEAELQKARNQLRARLVFENDSITNIAHQLGYFETIGSWRLYPVASRADRRGDGQRGGGCGGRAAQAVEPDRRLVRAAACRAPATSRPAR